MRSAVDLSATDQRLTPTVGAPAYMKARVSPMTPSPRASRPSPVSQAESITSGEARRRLKTSSVRRKPSAPSRLPTSESTTPVNCGRCVFRSPCVAK